MKKLGAIALVAILALSVALVGCGATETSTEITNVRGLFPEKDIVKVFKGGATGKGEVSIYQSLTDDRFQQSSMASDMKLVEVYEFTEEGLLIIAGSEVDNFKSDYTYTPRDFEYLVIKNDLKVGDKWGIAGYETEITAINKEIETPYGKLNTLELTGNGGNFTSRMYYANGLGLVKYVIDDEPFIELHSVEDFEKDLKVLSEEQIKELYENYISKMK